jgi:hypothetical protein
MSQFNSGGGLNDSGRSDYERDDVSSKVGDDCECTGSQFAETRGQGWAEQDRSGGAGDSGLNRPRFGRDAADSLQSHADNAKQKISHAAQEIGEAAHEVGGAARDLTSTASQFAERERSRAADVVEIFADAIRDAGRRLMEEPRTREVGILGDAAAEKVQQASAYLREHNTRDLVCTVSNLARKNPEIFLGAMATAGLAMARLIKATERRPEPTPEPTATPSGMDGDWTPGGSRYQPVVSDYPVNVSAREDAIGQTGAAGGQANTTPESELPMDPTPGSEKPRLTEEGI